MSSNNTISNIFSNSIISILLFRAHIYSVISHLFLLEPTKEYLRELVQDPILKSISTRYSESELKRSTVEFLEAVEELLNAEEQQLIDVWAEYTRLFIAPRPIAVPFESVQRGGPFKGKLWEEVREWFLEDGFILEDKSVLEDHAGVELEYMAKTCLRSYELLNEGSTEDSIRILERQWRFMEEHVMKWIPRLCDVISQNSKSSFYRTFARLTKSFLEEDFQLLDELLTYLKLTS